ncbi:MAG: diguanylate cyclase [Oscillospiraceae bacterium]|nr:diguanylate cyclase [Oscillospiraceae bacterium]
MYSIRTKITLLTVCAIVAAMSISTIFGVFAIKNFGDSSSKQMLLLLCETGEKNLDSYFGSVQQSVEMVAAFVEADLTGLEADQLESHMSRASAIFGKTASRTIGVLTYYYRVDPAISDTVKGFWYIKSDEGGFQEHEVTDITLYDTGDTSALVWFTVPKATGKAIWLPPYVTDNLNVRVISYNVPIYWNGVFVGVVGIEIDYSTMSEQVDNIRLYENGYAFINDADGNIIYHPRIDVVKLTGENRPKTPYGLLSEEIYIQYTYDGVKKQAVWLPLSNGMRLNVTVPVSEINNEWQNMIYDNFSASVFLLVVFIIMTTQFTDQITAPLGKLTEAAKEVNAGNYDFELDYNRNDEVGILTQTFRQLIRYLKTYISDLNDMAYADALTSVHNKGAFDIYTRDLQARINNPDEKLCFAVGVFDCDNLKAINDQYGHDKGDIYLKTATNLICRVFKHSPVFRTGGDEFTVVIQNEDYENRAELMSRFEKQCAEVCAAAGAPWEEVHVSLGIDAFDPENDCLVSDVVRRADKLMYENKRGRKMARRTEGLHSRS